MRPCRISLTTRLSGPHAVNRGGRSVRGKCCRSNPSKELSYLLMLRPPWVCAQRCSGVQACCLFTVTSPKSPVIPVRQTALDVPSRQRMVVEGSSGSNPGPHRTTNHLATRQMSSYFIDCPSRLMNTLAIRRLWPSEHVLTSFTVSVPPKAVLVNWLF